MKQQIKYSNIFISWSLVFLVLCWHSASEITHEDENEREFDYTRGGEKGPSKWGQIKREWKACNGSSQSPIDMTHPRVRHIGKSREMMSKYNPSNATVINRGHDIEIQWDLGKAGSVYINGTTYLFQQAHWHSPSEHSINGRRYDMELHLVHKNPDEKAKNKLAVTAFLYTIGKPDAFLSQLTRNISDMADQMVEKKLGLIDPRDIKLRSKTYYRYIGSLTIPPCTEGVIWTINRKLMTVSRDQLHLLRNAVHDYAAHNARPEQPLNHRDVTLYDT